MSADGTNQPRDTHADGTSVVAPIVPGDRILRARDVVFRVGVSRTTLWRLCRRGMFPAPLRISANVVGWRASQIDAFIASRAPSCAPPSEATSRGGAS